MLVSFITISSFNYRYNLLPQQLWKAFLLSEEQMDFVTLLSLDGNHLHLPTQGEKQLFERAVEVMQWMSTKVNVCLYWNRETPACQSLCESLLEALPFISSLRFGSCILNSLLGFIQSFDSKVKIPLFVTFFNNNISEFNILAEQVNNSFKVESF